MAKKPNVFISFHHTDLKAKKKFENIFVRHYKVIASSAVNQGKIPEDLSPEKTMQIIQDNHIKNSTITIVLIGKNTFKSKFVDWEIKASLREIKEGRKRSGLIGIFLPDFKNGCKKHKALIPPRLTDNIKNKYAQCHDWTDDPKVLETWIEEAKLKRKTQPNNRRHLLGK